MIKQTNSKTEAVKTVRTRVAPSPTGDPHVGTAYQALFNYVYAKAHQGQFLLRVEDTDQKRFVASSEQVIYDALAWLGLSPDESPKVGGQSGPYRQSERLEIYQKYAQQLIDQGDAYYCFCTPERLQTMRQEQQKQHLPPKYDGHCRQLSAQEVAKRLANGEKAVIRMKIPVNQEIIVKDVLRGDIKFDSNIVDEQVILKSDGFPTYHLAVVVDDHLMGITHMLRGEEWLPSAPKHVLLYQYFNWQMPVMIHTPILRNPDRSKLSKRQGHTSLWWYREQGFLPAALLNFLALIVWKPKDQRETFSLKEMMAEFDWAQLNVTGPVVDLTKMTWLNGWYLRQLSNQQLAEQVQAWATWAAQAASDEQIKAGAHSLLTWQQARPELFAKALALAHERLKCFSELANLLDFYFIDQLEFDRDDLLQKQAADQVAKVLQVCVQRFEELTRQNKFEAEPWEACVRSTADEFGLKHKDLFMSLRSAVTARKFTPPLFEVMQTLGPKNSCERISQAIRFLSKS